MDCHKSGRPLLLESRKEDATQEKKLKPLNDRILSYGVTGLGGFFTLPADFPALGPHIERKPSEFEDCSKPFFGELTPTQRKASLNNVLKAMDCARCHDGVRLGRMTAPSQEAFRRIKQGRMPPDMELTQPEIQALNACMMEEYFGQDGWLAAYLNAGDCKLGVKKGEMGPRRVGRREKSH
jgi:hypothetical protein